MGRKQLAGIPVTGDAHIDGIKIQKTPKTFFDADAPKRRVEMMAGSTNYFHSLRSPVIINLMRTRAGRLTYFFTIPTADPRVKAGMVAQLHRWDIFCEKAPVTFDNVFPSETTAGALITFSPEQHFWDRTKYTQVQHPNFFKVFADVKVPLWIQVILVPTKPAKVQRPLAKLYKGEFRKFARKERRRKLDGALRNQYVVLSTRHQKWMTLAQEESLFAVTYRVAVPGTIDVQYLDKKRARAITRPPGRGQDMLATQEGGKEIVAFHEQVRELAASLFIGIPGSTRVKYQLAKDIWAQLNSSKIKRQPPNHVMLGRSEVEWVFPWPVHNFFGWDLLADKVTDIEGQGRYFPLKEQASGTSDAGEDSKNGGKNGIFLGYQATQASEAAVTDLPLTRPLTTSLGIFGYPGTGKTNQVNNILQQLLARGENVLYLNGVKDEEHLAALAPGRARIWRPQTLGIDPFEYIPGIPAMRMVADFVEGFTYTKNLYVALENLMRVGLMKYAIYLGWGTTLENLNQDNGGGRKFDLKKLHVIVQEELKRSKYAGETRGNLEGATETRVRGFLYSPIGQVFTSNPSIPVHELASGFNIVLLNKLQVDDQCFIAWVLLKKIYQYLTSQKERGQKTALTIVLEEAHVFLTQTKTHEESEYGKARAMLAEFLAMLIKEGREYGVRLIIVDQEPSDLIRSAIQPLAETLVFRAGKLDAAIFHQDPDLVAAIDSLPDFFAIYKGKEVTHEVLLRPPKFEEPPQEAVVTGIKQAVDNTKVLVGHSPESNENLDPIPTAQETAREAGPPPKPLLNPSPESFKNNEENLPPNIEKLTTDLKCDDTQNLVFEYLVNCNAQKGATIEQIEGACKMDRPKLLKVLTLLKNEGSIHETWAGKYAIA